VFPVDRERRLRLRLRRRRHKPAFGSRLLALANSEELKARVEIEIMEFRAEKKFLRVSPQKARLVLDLIKGRRVEDARNTLLFTKKRVAEHVGKLLQSALDNANFLATEKGLDVEIDNLYVKSAIANDGPRMKRIRPAPQGRAYRYQRRIAHIELILAERGKNGNVATVIGEETAAAPVKARRRVPAAKAAGKKKVAAK
jgi:large subunit ribosomal protein L22